MNALVERFAPLAIQQFWQVTIVTVVVALVVRLLCQRRPHLAYMLWMLVVIKCLTPPVWSSPIGVFSWAGARQVAPATGLPIEADPMLMDVARLHEAKPSSGSVRVSAESTSQEDKSTSPTTVVAAVWLIGCLVFAGILIVKRIVCGLVLRQSGEPADAALAIATLKLSERMGLWRRVRVLVVSRPIGPAVYGIFRPTMVLPKLLLEEKPFDQIRPIFAHELVHLRRNDPAAGLLQLVAQMIWWFHPLVWWANRQLCRERERLCDEEAVAALKCPPHAYAQSLVDIVKLRHRLRPVVGLPGVRPFEITRQRLENIMNRTTPFHPRMPRPYWLVLVAGVLLLLPGAGLTIHLSAQAAGEQPLDQTTAPPFSPGEHAAASQPAEPAEDDAAAAAALKDLGAELELNTSGRIVRVSLVQNERVSDDDLKLLETLTELRSLRLDHTKITDKGLEHVKGLTHLRVLGLQGTPITNKGLEHIAGLTNLETLYIANPDINDVGIKHLRGLTHLQTLNLVGTKVTDTGLEHLKGLTNMKRLVLWNCAGVTHGGMEHLAGLTNLELLNLSGTRVSDAGLVHLKGMTDLATLWLPGDQLITDAGLAHISGLSNLAHLWLTKSQATNVGMKHLSALTNLVTLYLDQTNIGDAGLEHIHGLNNLKTLNLQSTKVTDAGVNKLKKAVPDCEIQMGDASEGRRYSVSNVFRRFDRNEDGKLTKEELPGPRRTQLLPAFDSDNDGAISKEELKRYLDQ